MIPAIGSAAPDFQAPADSSETLSLADYKGKWIILYFYPKDNTSGCTQQACDFRDSMNRLQSADVQVLGVSPDSLKSHRKFKADFELNFPLISDENKEICQAYGVWVQKSMYGRSYMGVERTTFIIDPQGIIQHIFPKVKVPGHVQAIIEWMAANKS
jgi:peroxiredoxin Q/BCP